MESTFRKDPLSYQPGDEVEGRYRITGVLGKGGFGAVYSAVHVGTHQPIALKMLTVDPSTTDDDVMARFLREARITAQLRSHHTVRVFDVGEATNGPMFMAMELLKGPELEKVLREQKRHDETMPEGQAVHIAAQILTSLGEAHRSGLVHRDLKPANIMLADMGEDEPVVKVLDFGIARTEDSSLTGSGKALGTPAYMSPEQCLGRDLDGRSDLYSLGVILYRCLTGRLPFENSNSLALLNMHVREPVPQLRASNPRVSEPMEAVILRALQKAPQDRFEDAREMRHALRAALEGEWTATPSAPMDALRANDVAGAATVALDAADGNDVTLVPGRGPSRLPRHEMSDAPTMALDSPSSSVDAVSGPEPRDQLPPVGEVATVGAASRGWPVLAALVVLAVCGTAFGLWSTDRGKEAPGRQAATGGTLSPVAANQGGNEPGAPGNERKGASNVAGPLEPQALTPPVDVKLRAIVPDGAAVVAGAPPAAGPEPASVVEAEAKVALAMSATALADKIRHMRDATALVPDNNRYKTLLATFEAEQQRQLDAARAPAPTEPRPTTAAPAAAPSRAVAPRSDATPRPKMQAPPAAKPVPKPAPTPATKEVHGDESLQIKPLD